MKRPKVLCVDDDAGFRSYYQTLLTEYGYDVTVAQSGAQALELLDSDPNFEAVISDYEMPRMNGAELAAVLKHNYPGLPFIMVSASQPVLEDAEHFVDAALPKGSSAEDLVTQLDTLLAAQRHPQALRQTASRYAPLGTALATVAGAVLLLLKSGK